MRTAPLASISSWFLTGFILLMVVSCSANLAPPFDKKVADGLDAVNIEIMTLFATTSQGTNKDTFPSREEKYNSVIGKLDALALSAGARPIPKNSVTQAINHLLDERQGKPLADQGSTPPDAYSINKISETITEMRETDRKQGVTSYEAQAFKRQASIYLDQAITYENFLQR